MDLGGGSKALVGDANVEVGSVDCGEGGGGG